MKYIVLTSHKKFWTTLVALIEKPMLVITDKPKLKSSNGMDWLSLDTRYPVFIIAALNYDKRIACEISIDCYNLNEAESTKIIK